MKYGPVDVVVLAVGEPHFDGSVLTELEKLVKTGTIRVLDAMVIVMGPDGQPMSLDLEDLPDDQKAALGFIETGTRGLFDSEDAKTLAEGMVEGSAVVALAIENAWAVPLINAWSDAGVSLAMHSRIPAPVVEDAMASMMAGVK